MVNVAGSRLRFGLALALLAAAGAALFFALRGESRAQPFDQFLYFPGPGSGYIEVPHDPALNPTDAITIEAWVFLTSYDAWGADGLCPTIIGKDFLEAYWLGLCSGRIRFYAQGGGSSQNGVSQIPLNTWTHIALTYDGTTMNFYINGELDMTTNAVNGPLTQSTDPVRIGQDVSWDATPAGAIDEVRLWGVARTQEQIQSTMDTPIDGPTAGLIAVWNMDGDATDAIGGHDGALQGDAQFLEIIGPFAAGDVDCDGDVDAVDALRILRHVAALPNDLPLGCPEIGSVPA